MGRKAGPELGPGVYVAGGLHVQLVKRDRLVWARLADSDGTVPWQGPYLSAAQALVAWSAWAHTMFSRPEN